MVLKPGRGKAIRCDDERWTCEGNRETIFGTTKDEQDTKLGRAEGVGQGLTRGVTGAIFWDHEIHEIHEKWWRAEGVGTGAYRGRDGGDFLDHEIHEIHEKWSREKGGDGSLPGA